VSIRPEILTAFREHRVRCTPQRYAILEHLIRNGRHPTADEIHTAINRTDPRASIATVYKSLHAMSAAGLIREVLVDGHAVRFEWNTQQHHHFICEACGSVENIDWFEVSIPRRERNIGRQIQKYEVVMRGLCSHCKSRN